MELGRRLRNGRPLLSHNRMLCAVERKFFLSNRRQLVQQSSRIKNGPSVIRTRQKLRQRGSFCFSGLLQSESERNRLPQLPHRVDSVARQHPPYLSHCEQSLRWRGAAQNQGAAN